jgi:hypothetical protein
MSPMIPLASPSIHSGPRSKRFNRDVTLSRPRTPPCQNAVCTPSRRDAVSTPSRRLYSESDCRPARQDDPDAAGRIRESCRALIAHAADQHGAAADKGRARGALESHWLTGQLELASGSTQAATSSPTGPGSTSPPALRRAAAAART